MNEELKEVLEHMSLVANREIPALFLAPEYTKLVVDYINELETIKNKAIKELEDNGIDEEMMKSCNIYDVNGIELMKILKGEEE